MCRRRLFLPVLVLYQVGLFFGCISSKQVRRVEPVVKKVQPKVVLVVQARPTPFVAPRIPLSTDPRVMLRSFGQRVLAQGERYRKRALHLQRSCQSRKASRRLCGVYWRAQRIFAINYRTRRSHYRGYMMMRRRGRRRIPRSLMRWHKRMSRAKYLGKGGRCYLDKGISSSCMDFAMCAVRSALRDFSGPWGKGFVYPTWGYVNYWTNRAYYALYYDRKRKGVAGWGIRRFLRERHTLPPATQKRVARRLVRGMHKAFMRIVRRKLRGRNNRRIYRKLFCTNIVSGIGRFARAQPGDLFAISYIQKRRRRSLRLSGVRFQHWGIVAKPNARKVLHNQTPGGTWGRKFTRWGIQYGTYSSTFTRGKWAWKRRRRRFEKRVVFFNRLNAHFFYYARSRNTPIYRPHKPSLCQDWIKRYGEAYFAIPTTPQPTTPGPAHLASSRIQGPATSN